MHAIYEVSISNGSKVIVKVKVDNRQTDKQTDGQDKNNMPLIIRSGGIKISGETWFPGKICFFAQYILKANYFAEGINKMKAHQGFEISVMLYQTYLVM